MLPDTVLSARNALASRQISSVELTRAMLDRISRLDPTLRAYTAVFPDRALDTARQVDSGQITGPLAGVPIAIKDNLCTRFGRTTCSSRMLEHFHAPYDATVVRRLEAAGAVLIGKTNLDEFAMGSSTENSFFGPTRNPWDPSRVPGGSSGGSAAALAASTCCAAIGSDTGGSIRQPASLCGLVGLKPSYGRVSRYGLVAFASSLDQIGPFGWTVPDVALLLNIIAGHDPRDSTSVPNPPPDYLANLETPLADLRIGVVREYSAIGSSGAATASNAAPASGVHPEVQAAVDAALAVYRSLGARIVDISLPHAEYGIPAYYVIAPSEASSNLARYDGVHFGHRTQRPVADIIDLFSQSRFEGFGPEVQRRIMIGTYALSSGYYDAYYLRAQKIRSLIKRDFDDAFTRCDVIACPTSPIPAFPLGEKSGDPLQMYLCDIFTVTCNIAAIAGLSLPCGFTSGPTPLPIGLQLLGPAFAEDKLLRVARMYEQATPWHTRRPTL